MTQNHCGDLVLTKEEYNILREKLAEFGVALKYSVTDCKTYECYVRNPYKEATEGWGSDLEKKQAKEFAERYGI